MFDEKPPCVGGFRVCGAQSPGNIPTVIFCARCRGIHQRHGFSFPWSHAYSRNPATGKGFDRKIDVPRVGDFCHQGSAHISPSPRL